MVRRMGGAKTVLFVWSLMALALSAIADDAVQAGSEVLYTDAPGHAWCVTVVSLDIGVDGERWAWFTVNADPRRTGHVPITDLGHACEQPVVAAARR
jgi:opacity protein-like surface antigen